MLLLRIVTLQATVGMTSTPRAFVVFPKIVTLSRTTDLAVLMRTPTVPVPAPLIERLRSVTTQFDVALMRTPEVPEWRIEPKAPVVPSIVIDLMMLIVPNPPG